MSNAVLKLVRFPGVFTALADVLAGYMCVRFSGGSKGEPELLLYLLAAGACLYMGGMSFNDVLDMEKDRESRPRRPIPSGSISLTTAF